MGKFFRVFLADDRVAHIFFVPFPIAIERRGLAFYPLTDRVVVEAYPGEQPVDEHKGDAGDRRRNKGRSADDYPAEDGSEHNDDDVIEG